MAAEAGDLGKTNKVNVKSHGVAAAANIAKGDVITFDAGGDAIVASDTNGTRANGFGVAVEAQDNTSGADGDLKVRFATKGCHVYVTADGTIEPQQLVKVATATDGQVIAHASPANATTPTAGEVDAARDFYGLTVGRYIGHEGEEDDATQAVDGEVIMIELM